MKTLKIQECQNKTIQKEKGNWRENWKFYKWIKSKRNIKIHTFSHYLQKFHLKNYIQNEKIGKLEQNKIKQTPVTQGTSLLF